MHPLFHAIDSVAFWHWALDIFPSATEKVRTEIFFDDCTYIMLDRVHAVLYVCCISQLLYADLWYWIILYSNINILFVSNIFQII